jgi:hypothetical protein
MTEPTTPSTEAGHELLKELAEHTVYATAALPAILAIEAQARKPLELRFRRALWLSHGHHGYGDDGEMQCVECAPFGVSDYLRDPLDSVEAAYAFAKLTGKPLELENERLHLRIAERIAELSPADGTHIYLRGGIHADARCCGACGRLHELRALQEPTDGT